jgi:hypothetical protein
LAGLIIRLIAAAFAMRAVGASDGLAILAVPLRDLFGFAVWAAGIAGHKVEWRDIRFQLLADGRIKQL